MNEEKTMHGFKITISYAADANGKSCNQMMREVKEILRFELKKQLHLSW